MNIEHERTEDFKTACKACVFASFENGQQVDCDLGRLFEYDAQGLATKLEDGSYQIHTICNACRGTRWMSQQPLNTNLIAKVEDEIKVSVAFIIVAIEPDVEKLLQLLHQRLSECANQKQVKASEIIILLQNPHVKSSEVYELSQTICGDTACKLVKVVDNNLPLDQCIDIGVQHIANSRYYLVAYLTHRIPLTVTKLVNDLINTKLQMISLIKPTYGFSGMFIQTMLHKIFSGNKGMPIYEKIEEAAKLQNKEKLILTWDEVWNCQE